MRKDEFYIIWRAFSENIVFLVTIFLPNFGTVITKIIIKIHLQWKTID